MWSRTNLESYMAVTAHYVLRTGKHLHVHSNLVAFRYIDGSHSGANIGKEFVRILEEIDCLHKVCFIASLLLITH